MGLQLDDIKGERSSETAIAGITGLDRRTVKKYLDEAELEFTDGKSGGKDYLLVDAIRALIRASKGQNSADRRNDAQARKLELEAGIIEKNYIKVGEVAAPFRAYLGAVNREVQDSELEDDRKERLVEKLKDCYGEQEQLTGREIENNQDKESP